MPVVRSWSFAVFIFLVVLAHFTLRLAIGAGAGMPDLLTVAALLAARRLSGAQAAALGLLLGVLDDALTVVAFGSAAVALTVVSFLGARSRELFEGDSVLFLTVYLFVGKWLRDALVYLLSPTTRTADTVPELFIGMPLSALAAAVAGVVAIVVYRAATGERA
jgi:rod shape-determining protein MreD